MKISISSEIKLIEVLHNMGVCSEAVLLTLNGRLVPETITAKKGDELKIIFYKHVPPFLSEQELKGHWKKAEYKCCDSCKESPVVYLPHTKQHLCKKHFTALFEKTAKKTIRLNNMLDKNERIGIGLSGGKDSFALLNVLSRLKESLPFEIIALTIDEGIPGYRDKAVENASKRCKELGIEQHCYSFQQECGTTIIEIANKGKENLCSYCGVLRRKILNSKSRELNLHKIAIGHNLDDIAQTAMLNMIRNEPLRFARFNTPLVENKKMIPRIRPLKDIREKEVAAYAFLMGHEYNSGCCCPYSKNSLRKSVRHELNFLESQHPGTKNKIAASFGTLQKAVRDSVSKQNLEIDFCEECGEPSATNICMSCKMLADL